MKNEIAFNHIEAAIACMKLLIEENYVCMISREEELYIINYEWTEYCDRNEVVFMPRYEFDDKYYEKSNLDLTEE